MKLNDIREVKSAAINNLYQKRIEEIGRKNFLKELKQVVKKETVHLIKESYNFFKNDVKCYPYAVNGISDISNGIIDTINRNKNNISIFEIDDDEIDYNVGVPLLPFDKFYIATNIAEVIDEDLITINGFFVMDMGEDLLIMYCYSKTIDDGWSFASTLLRKKSLSMNNENIKIDFHGDDFDDLAKKINQLASKKFHLLMKKLLYKLEKKEYSSYKKYSYGSYEEKKITFTVDVRSHKRHFWEDSGRFKIPLMSREELKEKGYGIDEMVYKNGELRENVPYRIIGEFIVGEQKRKEENKVYDMIDRRQLRQEEKLFKILREIFPDNHIKRHDRKVLKGLELDFLIRDLRIAFEYDGEQHFDRELCENVFKSDFDALKQRDRKKDKLCRKKNIKLIRIKYDEPLTKRHISKKLKEK